MNWNQVPLMQQLVQVGTRHTRDPKVTCPPQLHDLNPGTPDTPALPSTTTPNAGPQGHQHAPEPLPPPQDLRETSLHQHHEPPPWNPSTWNLWGPWAWEGGNVVGEGNSLGSLRSQKCLGEGGGGNGQWYLKPEGGQGPPAVFRFRVFAARPLLIVKKVWSINSGWAVKFENLKILSLIENTISFQCSAILWKSFFDWFVYLATTSLCDWENRS